MRKLVFFIIGLFALFTFISAYANSKSTSSPKVSTYYTKNSSEKDQTSLQ